MKHKKSLLIILDGWGIGKNAEVDALANAETPYYDYLLEHYQHNTLVTYGKEVGLPEGQMGNSEVGHLNIGAGRIVHQELGRISKACEENTLINMPAMEQLVNYSSESGKAVHLLGLLSDGGVHSHIEHLKSIVDALEEKNIKEIFIHAFMDGRDTGQKSGINYMEDLQNHLAGKSTKVASIIGRYYAMDRDNRYERIAAAYNLLVHGEGEKFEDPNEALRSSYAADLTDEFVKPIAIQENGEDLAHIKDGDVVLFYNFRTDRPRQLTTALSQQDFPDHNMRKLDLQYYTMTSYDENFKNVQVVFSKDKIQKTIGEVVADSGLTQLRIAETEKYPHVTFFFSGGREDIFKGENRILIPSPKVATYDLQPEMSAGKITDSVVQSMESDQPDFICLNYANTDMVGHTGMMDAAIQAAETVDACLQRTVETALANDYEIIIIADHGNSDIMTNPDGSPHTAHTTNLVPIIYASNEEQGKLKNGKLGDISPTLLSLMGIEIPTEMDGEILVK